MTGTQGKDRDAEQQEQRDRDAAHQCSVQAVVAFA
jgi:hypothetical protein